ncbi:zinc-dependent metalloprotease [Rhizosphaericola mali]|uniref:Zinc-dependent metalloprotease n=1 Tax=Rhizosphaericola mali TaxID=2545455 RepID=A0A5P2G1S6_9BACT|nr:zinc-dependent metalloprotease [Rhizosphaericola mali]QES87792.1 zinc-dependent metalloprotease [Rhizosphaericola mali]
MNSKILMLLCGTFYLTTTFAQKPEVPKYPKDSLPKKDSLHLKDTTKLKKPIFPKPSEIKPYKEVIPDSAITHKGLFTIHEVEDKYFFEIPDSLFGREIMVVTRYVSVPGGAGVYGGEIVNQQTIEWIKGPNKNVFIKLIADISMADSTNKIYKAVKNSYANPLIAAFPIKAFGKDSSTVVLDVTDFFKGDNQLVSLTPDKKRGFNLSMLMADRSYINSIHTYPINVEIKSTKTFGASPAMNIPGMMTRRGGGGFTVANDAGVVTMELNNSFLLLPKTPVKKRLFDPRVGYFADSYTVYGDNQQKVDDQTFIVRWNLEPKPEDVEKWKKGQLVEPKKQIVYYIDPATPKQWRPYLIAGINDWQKAFESAGFKNAIVGKEWPENDTTMSMEDARYSVVRYFASNIENAYGPNVHDPRSGQILESHIGWYHNVMKLVHDWYMIQAGAIDPKARKMKFDDELMGQLIRFVSSHEIGHTLGLRHNMGSSSKTPVELLRNKKWVEANGHTASIMDYARFNYVAQPEDNISEKGIFPRIGDYDKWAIKWGYSYSGATTTEEDKKIVNKWVVDALSKNSRLWFGGEGRNLDPRAQTEDLGDNNVLASEYGIKNLKIVAKNLLSWTNEEADTYNNLGDVYTQLFGEYNRFVNHVLKNVGGIEETYKSVEEPGNVYYPTSKQRQKQAVQFLNNQVFNNVDWLDDQNIMNKITNPGYGDKIANLQSTTLSNLLSSSRLQRLELCENRFGDTTYTPIEFITDVHDGIFSELKSNAAITAPRRSLQKVYVNTLIDIISAKSPASSGISPMILALMGVSSSDINTSDIPSIVKGHLKDLKAEIDATNSSDKLTKYHLADLSDRIKKALDPKD